MNETIPNVELLATCQQHGRSKQQDRDNLVQEILMLAQCLHLNPTPEMGGRGALGGMFYCIKRLYEQFDCQMTLEQIAERYAEVELQDYPVTDEDVDETRDWAKRQGLVLRVMPIACNDGKMRRMFVSHLNQTSVDGVVYKEGQFVHFPKRFPPPFAWFSRGTHFERPES